jgi:hypothetical protein
MRRILLLQLPCAAFAGALSGCEPTLDVGSWVARTDFPAVPAPTSVASRDAAATDVTESSGPSTTDTGIGGSNIMDASTGGSGPIDASTGGTNALDASSGGADAAANPACDLSQPSFMALNDAGEPLAWTAPVEQPWSTSFEDNLCEYSNVTGYCYSSPGASYEIVTSPVRTGQFAMAFTVNTDDAVDGTQSRCVRQGLLPTAAYYGAWYYIPALVDNTGNWNLFYFQGGETAEASNLRGLWDVSLTQGGDGQFRLFVRNFVGGLTHDLPGSPPIPIGSWFHLEMYLHRAPDATGEMALYQDGQLLLQLQDVITDDSQWAQWYLGNLADSLNPAISTLYVDDVTIRESR